MHRALTAAIFALLLTPPLAAAEPELVSTVKIWDAASHNAFTDLVRTEKEFLCVFRESRAHVGGDGAIRVLAWGEAGAWK